jgi:hypothetical protein
MLAKRAVRFQNNCFSVASKTPEQARNGEVPVNETLERCMRYHASHDRDYQRASAELQKRKRARQLAEIGFASQNRQQAAEKRKAEKHALQIATANIRKQREEIKLGNLLADLLPRDFDPSSLPQSFFATAPRA